MTRFIFSLILTGLASWLLLDLTTFMAIVLLIFANNLTLTLPASRIKLDSNRFKET